MKRFLKWSGLVALGALLPLLMAPTGGIPTIVSLFGIRLNPNSITGPTSLIRADQQITYSLMGPNGTGKAGPGIVCRWDGATANRNCKFGMYDNSNVFTSQFQFGDTSLAANTFIDSGNITINFQTGVDTSCTVNGTNGTMIFHKVGNVVTGRVTVAGSCTTASGTNMATGSTTPTIPALFRPVAQSCGTSLIGTATNDVGFICVSSSGALVLNLKAGTTATSFGLLLGETFTYTLD